MKNLLKLLKAKSAEMTAKLDTERATAEADLETVKGQIADSLKKIDEVTKAGNAEEYRKLMMEMQDLNFRKAYLETKISRIETEPFYICSESEFKALTNEAQQTAQAEESAMIDAVKSHLTEAIRVLNEYVTAGLEADNEMRNIQFNLAKDPSVYYRTADGLPITENRTKVKAYMNREFTLLLNDLKYSVEKPILKK